MMTKTTILEATACRHTARDKTVSNFLDQEKPSMIVGSSVTYYAVRRTRTVVISVLSCALEMTFLRVVIEDPNLDLRFQDVDRSTFVM